MTPQIRREVIYKHVVQDIIIPIDEMSQAIDNFHEWFEIYPLLVFPIAIYGDHKYSGFLRKPRNCKQLHGRVGEMFFDLGAYGVPQKVRDLKEWDAKAVIKKMEQYTRDIGGYQCLYSDTFMTREEFRVMFDHTHYDEMREKYQAVDAFPEVFYKVRPEAGVIDEE
jgi:delta24-sterol reductase